MGNILNFPCFDRFRKNKNKDKDDDSYPPTLEDVGQIECIPLYLNDEMLERHTKLMEKYNNTNL